MRGAAEVFVLANCDIKGQQSEAATKIDFLVGVIEITAVEVTGVADNVAEFTHFTALAEVAVDFETVFDISCPCAGEKPSCS